ncbi:MAG: HEAT repeat domain-containing protein [Deltaproteobacteria bacterium]|nr:HEAT repeat domain-containing protein [Deltaproteobacteria bacterium]MBI3017236.1 HEAT repeat domain-containing protein [Deltaproteobacteria bacterium]
MQDKISYFIRNLKQSDWRIKSQAYADLMNFSEPQAVPLLWKAIDSTDELLLIYFCRWISKNVLLEGIPYLLSLVNDERLRLSKEAVFSLEKLVQSSNVPEKAKVHLLIELLLQGKEGGQLFSARMCAKYRKKAGGPYLIEVLQHSPSAKVRVACVDALRENQDERALPHLVRSLTDSDTNVLYALIFALGDFGDGTIHWKILRPFLKDPRVTIRHVSIWAIGRLGGKKAFQDLVDVLKTDLSTVCRIEACKRLARISSGKIIPALLEAASLDSDSNVKNIAHFCLDKLSPEMAFKKYYQLRKSKDPHVRVEDFMQLAKTQHPKALRYLSRVLKKEKNPQLQAAAAEALGYLERKETIPILKEALFLHPVIAYSAMVSLAQLMGPEEIPFMLDVLNNSKTSTMTQQVILKHLLAKAKDKKIFFFQPLVDTLIQKIYSADINLSYLAAMILGESHDLSAVIPLFELSRLTQDPEVQSRSLKAIETLLGGNVSVLIKLLAQKFLTPTLYVHILKSLSLFTCKVQYKRDALVRLFMLLETASSEHRVYFLSAAHRIVGKDVDILLMILKQTTWSPSVTLDLFTMVEGLTEEGDVQNSLLAIEAFRRGLKHSEALVRRVSARMLEKISQGSALGDLLDLVYRDQDPKVSQYAKIAVRTLVNHPL